MGTVYEAIDLRLNNQVALKEMISNGSATAVAAFEREAQLLANLDHQNLPKVTDYFSENDGNFLVMQFIKGLDLQEWLESRGRAFPQSQVLDWADLILGVLEYLHRHSPPILHRDIKPANIKASEHGRLFLLDFGLAKGSAGQMATYSTERSLRGGTPPYESLEQLLGQRTEPCSDLYSVGATIYHLISGIVPTNAAARHQDIEDHKPDPLHFGSEFTPAVAEVIYRAMSISRRDRTSSATEMRRALRSAAEEDHRAIIEADYRLAEERRRLRDDDRQREQAAKDASVEVLNSTLIFEDESEEEPSQGDPGIPTVIEPPIRKPPSPAAVRRIVWAEPATPALPMPSTSIRLFIVAPLAIVMTVALFVAAIYYRISRQSNSNQAVAESTPLPTPTPTLTPTPTASPSIDLAVAAALAEKMSFTQTLDSGDVVAIDANVLSDNTNNGWTNTGLYVRRGQNLLITASGKIDLGFKRFTGPQGIFDLSSVGNTLMKAEPIGGLIAVIGDDNDDFMFVGAAKHIVAKRNGTLFLGVNEEALTDNSGSFAAVIEFEKSPPRPKAPTGRQR